MADPLSKAPGPSSPITVGASPFTFQDPFPGNVVISGGTVSAIEVSRDGTNFLNAGVIGGTFFLCAGDDIRVTYAVTPTMTWLPV